MAEQETNVLVAIPNRNDPAWKVSSEKVPHITLLYLEDLSQDDDLPAVVQFLQHAVKTSLSPFYLEVDRRGTLGPDEADVVFFTSADGPDPLYSANRDIKKLAQFRQTLLQNKSIAQAYNAVPQFPQWTPHLTLGYPTDPAHDAAYEYGITYVQFDKIALWTEDSNGMDFQMSPKQDLEVSMSNQDLVDDILAHHGVKGMKWGVRKDGSTSGSSTTTSRLRRPASDVTVAQKPGQFVRTSGGRKQTAADDAVRVAAARQLAKKSTTDALTTKQLQEAVTRMNLEQQYSQLVKKADRRTRGTKFVHSLLGVKHPSQTNGNSAKQSGASDAAKKVAVALAKSAAVAA